MSDRSYLSGLAAATFAYVCWGLLPIYWKVLGQVPALEIICHRVVWSLVFTGALLVALGRLGEVFRALRTRRDMLLLAASSSLIGLNWFLYVWAVNDGHVLEASLGYYLNPLVNVVLGVAVFGDRLGRPQRIAVGLAALGVAVQLVAQGRLPWIALALAISFGLYGMVRKLMSVESLPGLFLETLFLTVPAGGYLGWLYLSGLGAMGHLGLGTDLLLAGAGVVTGLPLLAFAFGARRITMTTLGILQYLGPTGMLLLGVLVYGESFGPSQAVTFGLIWAGVALYTVDGFNRLRGLRLRQPGGAS